MRRPRPPSGGSGGGRRPRPPADAAAVEIVPAVAVAGRPNANSRGDARDRSCEPRRVFALDRPRPTRRPREGPAGSSFGGARGVAAERLAVVGDPAPVQVVQRAAGDGSVDDASRRRGARDRDPGVRARRSGRARARVDARGREPVGEDAVGVREPAQAPYVSSSARWDGEGGGRVLDAVAGRDEENPRPNANDPRGRRRRRRPARTTRALDGSRWRRARGWARPRRRARTRRRRTRTAEPTTAAPGPTTSARLAETRRPARARGRPHDRILRAVVEDAELRAELQAKLLELARAEARARHRDAARAEPCAGPRGCRPRKRTTARAERRTRHDFRPLEPLKRNLPLGRARRASDEPRNARAFVVAPTAKSHARARRRTSARAPPARSRASRARHAAAKRSAGRRRRFGYGSEEGAAPTRFSRPRRPPPFAAARPASPDGARSARASPGSARATPPRARRRRGDRRRFAPAPEHRAPNRAARPRSSSRRAESRGGPAASAAAAASDPATRPSAATAASACGTASAGRRTRASRRRGGGGGGRRRRSRRRAPRGRRPNE